MNEIWKNVVGYEGLYEVSNLGNVASFLTNRTLKPFAKGLKHNYRAISLRKNGKQKNVGLHRIVAMAFIPNPCGVNVINHIDGNPSNNAASNLEWCTHSHNQLHAYATGLRNRPYGEANTNSKLTQREVDFLRWLKLHYPQISGTKISEFYSFSAPTINDVFSMRKWKERSV